MAALDFPTNPTIGQVYTANDKSFKWNGTSWINFTGIGFTGSRGYTGSLGNTGFTGSQGNTGYTGLFGAMVDYTQFLER